MTRFRDLAIGQSFDWINDERPSFTSFYKRCVKTGRSTYETKPDDGHTYRVGSINAVVHHVNQP